nr:ABC transporter family substrate-binding protein [Corynebacterium lactis]
MANPSDAPTVEGAPEQPVEKQAAPDEQAKMREVAVGVDEFVEGFNPHLLQDMSPVTSLVARLTLPSAFVPAPKGEVAGAEKWLLNSDFLDSAEPVGADGAGATTHVRYVIKQGAQWSDGTPISGEDFRYLYSQITSTPGAMNLASYELVDSIEVSNGGRQVDVSFKRPIAQWQQLFSNLLPAHLMRSSTDGFSRGLASRFPASGGQYSVESIDIGRNIIRLVRNDRYWGKAQANSEVVTLRAMRSAVDGAEQLRSGQIQAAQVRPAQTTALTYGLVPGAEEFIHEPPRSLVFSANLAAPRLGNAAIRKAVLGTIGVGQVAEVATGRSASATADAAVVHAPADAAERGSDAAETRSGAQPADQFSRIFNKKDPLRIGVISDGATAKAAAFAVADQLTASGIPATVVSTSPGDLLRTSLPFGTVDAVVSWQEQPSTMAAARDRYACTSGSVGSLSPEKTSSTSAESTETSTSTAAPRPRDEAEKLVADPLAAPSSSARSENVSGLCDPEIDRLLGPEQADVPAGLEQLIVQRGIEVNLVDDSLLTVVGAGIEMPPRVRADEWPNDPVVGRLVGLGGVRRMVESTDGRAATGAGQETTRQDATGQDGAKDNAGN